MVICLGFTNLNGNEFASISCVYNYIYIVFLHLYLNLQDSMRAFSVALLHMTLKSRHEQHIYIHI